MARARILSVLFLLPAVAAVAQQVPGFSDSIVVTATGDEENVGDVCAAVTVIGRDEIEATDHASAAALLPTVPGVTLMRSGLDNGVTSLFVRGTASTQTLVLFDGVRLNSPYFGGYDWSLPLAIGLERIEVVRGPFSALYGGDAVGGVVQLVPRRAQGDTFRALVEGGTSAWRRAEFEASAASGRLSVLAAGASRAGTGPLTNDDFASRTGMVDLGVALSGGGRLGLLARSATSRTEIPFSGASVTPHRHTSANETLAAIPLRLPLAPGTELDVTVSRVARDLTYRDPDDPYGFVASDTSADSTDGTFTLHARWGAHRFAAGGEWRRDRVTDRSSYGTNLDGRTLDTRGVFAQDQLRLGRGFELLTGLRYDRAEPWGGELSPRVTIGWTDSRLRTWVAFGRAFRAPGLGDLYYPYTGNPNLVPEHSRSFEAGVRVPLHEGAVEATAFSNRIRDLIDFDYAAQRSANIAQARQDGVELSYGARLGGGESKAALTWLDARDGTGARLARRPEWSASLVWYGALARTLDAAFELVFVGARPDLDPVTFATIHMGGFTTANAGLSTPITPAVTLRARAENLLDRRYQEVRGYPAPARRVILGVEVR
jgi:vitamin B12 transporter